MYINNLNNILKIVNIHFIITYILNVIKIFNFMDIKYNI